MATVYPENKIRPVAAALLQCLCTAALDNPSPPSLCGFRTGSNGTPLGGTEPGSDECCGGAAFVRVLRSYPSWGAPDAALSTIRCAQPFAVEAELSMWRCVPTGTIDAPPAQAAWDVVHGQLLDDRQTLMAAGCCFWGSREKGSVRIGEWTIIETSGGCVGSVLPLEIDLFGRAT